MISVGCSGWSYEEWVGPFYDSSERKFTQYAQVFSIAEIDSTFYRVPSPTVAKGMAEVSPKGFKFLPKFNRSITHEKKLGEKGDTGKDLESFLLFLAPIRQAGKLGPALLQLPPSFSSDEAGYLRDFLSTLPHWMQVAVEFRNTSLVSADILMDLADANAAYVAVDEPLLPPYQFVTANFSYVRFHGKGKNVWFDYHYSDDELRPWAENLKRNRFIDTYVLFNNHFHGYAVENALSFMNMLGVADDAQKAALNRMRSQQTLRAPELSHYLPSSYRFFARRLK